VRGNGTIHEGRRAADAAVERIMTDETRGAGSEKQAKSEREAIRKALIETEGPTRAEIVQPAPRPSTRSVAEKRPGPQADG
jgi:hypothetical protein